ncbi:hypothetical protein FM120_15835 [Sphingobacterium faecium PCAi_F2.5]|nr:hypothetical protein FM120_15835 [Sphingobacterium faecium PCAi_F2.5]
MIIHFTCSIACIICNNILVNDLLLIAYMILVGSLLDSLQHF